MKSRRKKSVDGLRYTVLQCEQRSPEWHKARAGRLTGSAAADMLAKVKSGESAERRDLRMQLVCERLTGRPTEELYVNKEMRRGIQLEPAAFGAYEALTGNMVERSGFVSCDDILAGCSLDGHVDGFRGIIEIKCPKSATHLRYLRGRKVPTEHLPQIRHNVWITGAQWADFVSFDDRFPKHLQLFVARIARSMLALELYEYEAMKFLNEVKAETTAVRAMRIAA